MSEDKLKGFAEVVQSVVRAEVKESFSQSRYPYTYACDFMRSHTSLIPEDILDTLSIDYMGIPSRSQMSQALEKWSARMGLEDKLVAEVLANGYLVENGIVNVPVDITLYFL